MSAFNFNIIPSQKGRIAIVTGSNIGLGYETALALAKKDTKVILACRNLKKANAAMDRIKKQVPEADLEAIQIDLSKLNSVDDFAEKYLNKYDQLDLLINNAGVMMPPYTLTDDGFELQLAANHLGHFKLTGLLLPTIEKTPNSRIVTLSSNAHKTGKINFDDLHSKNNYSALAAYGQSKLACLMFAYEMQRRLEKAGYQTISTAAHPGVSITNLVQHVPLWMKIVFTPFIPFVTHSPENGAKPTLYAALGDDVKGGDYFGPTGFNEMKGKAGKVEAKLHAHDEHVAKRLWEVSEELTKTSFLN